MTKRRAARAKPKQKREKIGITPHDPARPIGKGNPPVETQFGPGNSASVGKGRPRKLKEFQELILDTFAEELAADGRIIGTRAQAMIRLGLNKNPLPFLEYAFGKVPQHLTVEDVTDKPDSELVAELQSILDTAAATAGASDSGGTPAAGAGESGTRD